MVVAFPAQLSDPLLLTCTLFLVALTVQVLRTEDPLKAPGR